jgi:(1->4)-alpha-D-glucan 1-alpha-D-glucosylmutase
MNERLPPTIPTSTYRLQFSSSFGFRDARAIVPYLAALGAGAIYASPYLRARPGSGHGYDIIDHNALNPEIGTAEEHAAMIAAAQASGIGHILDFVPNHMGIGGSENPWWSDVLEWGERSPYAKYFDIDWHPQRTDLDGKVLLPFLGDHYGSVLERGELAPLFDPASGGFAIAYLDHRYPLASKSYALLLGRAANLAAGTCSRELFALAESFAAAAAPSSEAVAEPERARFVAARKALSELVRTEPAALAAVERALAHWRVAESDPAGAERLDALLNDQHYRLSFWRVSLFEINYRRFFDINDLAGLRVEDAEVFGQTHRFVFDLIADGRLQGLRIDHVDGLFDPAGYCRLVRDRAAMLGHPLYLVVEKILALFEALRDGWGIDGATGYDFMNVVNGLFVDSRAEFAFNRIYREFAANEAGFDEIAYAAKRHIIRSNLASELTVLANLLYRLTRTDRRSSDFTYDGLREALMHVVACFPVYRTYVTGERVEEEDRRFIEWAVTIARRRADIMDDSVFDFLAEVLTADITTVERAHYERTQVLQLAMKFQQYTSPVMAKAIEDTAFYRFMRLISLNEVGGDPSRFGTSIKIFHRHNEWNAKHYPHGMLATATHDHKRGEDARLRIDALSEMPGRWRRALSAFARRSKTRSFLASHPVPSANDEYALYQTLIGTWPANWLERDVIPRGELRPYLERIEGWLRKAVREAKVHSSWVNPNLAYEDAACAFARRLFENGPAATITRDFLPIVRDVAMVAMVSSLAQVTLKLTSPGIPDIYQGCELWDLSLVDPDNRRPVDFELRMKLLDDLRTRFEREDSVALARELLRSWHDGRIKLFITWRLLQLRNQRRDEFLSAGYRRLPTTGRRADRIVSFAREQVVIVAPRLVYRMLRLRDGMPELSFTNEQISLPVKFPRRFVNAFTGRHVAATVEGSRVRLSGAELLRDLPVAVLVPSD